jgi:hypothetical protein
LDKEARNGNEQKKVEFRNYRNIYNRTVRPAKKLYFEKELIKNQSNLKKDLANY